MTELCIVIAMTAVLMSFLVPVLGTAQARAYDATAQGCAHNYQYALMLRQVDLHSFRLPRNDPPTLQALDGILPACRDAHLIVTALLSTDVDYRFVLGDERGLSAYLVTPTDIEAQSAP